MTVIIEGQGKFEVFRTNHGHRILDLNDNEYYAWVSGDKGELLVRTTADHNKKETLQRGRFYLVNFKNEQDYRDMPHLFLERDDGGYEEMMLPNGLPAAKNDYQKLILDVDKVLSKERVEQLATMVPGTRAS